MGGEKSHTMAKQTCSLCGGRKGRHEEWGTHGKGWYPCSRCKGRGFTIVDDPPRPQKEVTPRPQRESRPDRQQTQRTERTERPQHTSDWREKTCAAPNCYNTVRYNVTWAKPPDLCPTHLAAKKAEW